MLSRKAKLFLEISQEVCNDFQLLSRLPHRLLENGIIINQKDLVHSQFHELSGLQPPLKSLTINGCDLSESIVFDIACVTDLITLHFVATTGFPEDWSWLMALQNLRSLNLTGSNTDSSSIRYIATLASLEDVSLQEQKLPALCSVAVGVAPAAKS